MTILSAKDFNEYWYRRADGISGAAGADGATGAAAGASGAAGAAGASGTADVASGAAGITAAAGAAGAAPAQDNQVDQAVLEIIRGVRSGGDRALREYSLRFDKSSPDSFEIPLDEACRALAELETTDAALVSALSLAASHIRSFAELQRRSFTDFEVELEPGLFTGQRNIPVERAAVYVPAGRFPLISTVLMGVIPAKVAGVDQVILLSPPGAEGKPDRRILAAAALAGADRIFAIGGAQAIAAAAYGTETVPRCDVIVGPGNKYVAAAKRLLFGQVGIDFVAGPTDVLIIADDSADPDRLAADLLAQAEHDPDARARTLLPDLAMARQVEERLEKRLATLSTVSTARSSLEAGGLIIIYDKIDEAIQIANTIAPEHLELHLRNPEQYIPQLRNYGSLFIGELAAEVLGDYSAGINHTLPTSGSARFTGGLSVRHFIKTVTSLRCERSPGFEASRQAAARIARAEGLEAHRQSAESRS